MYTISFFLCFILISEDESKTHEISWSISVISGKLNYYLGKIVTIEVKKTDFIKCDPIFVKTQNPQVYLFYGKKKESWKICLHIKMLTIVVYLEKHNKGWFFFNLFSLTSTFYNEDYIWRWWIFPVQNFYSIQSLTLYYFIL